MMASGNIILAWCGRDITAQLEGHLEEVVRLVGLIMKATT
jgi:hypothetical protein